MYFIKQQPILASVILFLVIFTFIVATKPRFLYNSDGSIRPFGIGYKNKTIFPIWLLSLLLGVFCYLLVNICKG
jgi:uncharacterized membrane protein YozB (DUF420 family)